MLEKKLSRFICLKELEVESIHRLKGELQVRCRAKSKSCVCPRCAQLSSSRYDSRVIRVRDEPLRKANVHLLIAKRRFYCKTCRKPFMESIDGIWPRHRTTQRLRRTLLWACQKFRSLKEVREVYRCSNSLIYKTVFEHLELKLREYQYPWPRVIGIDEHFFRRSKGYTEFFTVFTDMKNRRLREAVLGRSVKEVTEKVAHIEGRENVRWVVQDLSGTYRSLTRVMFPNAEIVADKFHVLRLLSPALRRRRIDITGDRRTLRIKWLLQKNRKSLDYFQRQDVDRFLRLHPELDAIYRAKERLHEFYRIKGYVRARTVWPRLIASIAQSQIPELKTLKATLENWREEILNYFRTGYTNARTEGFNRIASLLKNLSFGFKSARNYRLRLLSACAH